MREGTRVETGPGHKKVRPLVAYYDFGALSSEERDAMERHALACDACFEELARGAGLSVVVRERRDDLRRALAGAPGGSSPPAFVGQPPSASAPLVIGRSARRPRLAWIGQPRVAIPAALAVVLLVLVPVRLLMRSESYRSLASFSLPPAADPTTRAPEGVDPVRELLESGRSYLDLARHEEAERRFRAAVERDPSSEEAAHLLGLALARQGRMAEAIASLESALLLEPRSAGGSLAHVEWSLANATLAAGRLETAKALLKKVAAQESPFSHEARTLLEKLPP